MSFGRIAVFGGGAHESDGLVAGARYNAPAAEPMA